MESWTYITRNNNNNNNNNDNNDNGNWEKKYLKFKDLFGTCV